MERKSRFTLLEHLSEGYSAAQVSTALIRVVTGLPRAMRQTLTWDQGNEMFQHEATQRATGVKIYFADAHSPWQSGSNENTNGLLRQYFPKGTDLRTYKPGDIALAAEELDSRPRVVLRIELQVN